MGDTSADSVTSTRTLLCSRSRDPAPRRTPGGTWGRGVPTSTRQRTKPQSRTEGEVCHEVYLGKGDPASWEHWLGQGQVRQEPPSTGDGPQGQGYDVSKQDLVI